MEHYTTAVRYICFVQFICIALYGVRALPCLKLWCSLFVDVLTAGVQVELSVFLPGVAGNAAAVCAALPPRESSLPADGEEGWGWSRKRYCRRHTGCRTRLQCLKYICACYVVRATFWSLQQSHPNTSGAWKSDSTGVKVSVNHCTNYHTISAEDW